MAYVLLKNGSGGLKTTFSILKKAMWMQRTKSHDSPYERKDERIKWDDDLREVCAAVHEKEPDRKPDIVAPSDSCNSALALEMERQKTPFRCTPLPSAPSHNKKETQSESNPSSSYSKENQRSGGWMTGPSSLSSFAREAQRLMDAQVSDDDDEDGIDEWCIGAPAYNTNVNPFFIHVPGSTVFLMIVGNISTHIIMVMEHKNPGSGDLDLCLCAPVATFKSIAELNKENVLRPWMRRFRCDDEDAVLCLHRGRNTRVPLDKKNPHLWNCYDDSLDDDARQTKQQKAINISCKKEFDKFLHLQIMANLSA